jgi:phosphate transport system substrate-binding protein
MTRVLSALDFLLAFFLLSFPLPAQSQQQSQKIIIAGAQSLIPLAEKFSAQFHKQHPGIEIEIRRGNSNYAVNTVRNGETDIGLVARALDSAERAELHVEPLGHDAIILLSYPWSAVGELTLEQLRKIYLGKITNWREVGGEDKGIVPLTREQSSALHGTFIDSLFGKSFHGQEKAFVLRASKDKVLRTIKRIQGSLGYGIVRIEEAQAEGVKVLGIDGKFPTVTNIREELYPFTRPQLLVSKGRRDGVIQEWMSEFAKFANRRSGSEDKK